MPSKTKFCDILAVINIIMVKGLMNGARKELMTTGLLIVLLCTDEILQGKDKLFESQFNLSQFNK